MKKLVVLVVMLLQVYVYAQEIKFGKVSKEELQEQFYPKDSTADAAYLYRHRKSHFDYDVDDGFRVITEVHNRIKIYNSKGFNKGTQKIYFYAPKSGKKDKISDIKSYTFNLIEGKISKEKVSKKSFFEERINDFYSVKKIALPNINKFSVIDIKYIITSPFISIDDLKFQFDIPVKKLSYKVEIPQYFKYRQYSKGYYQVKPVTTFISKDIEFRTPDKMVTKSGGYVKERGEIFRLNASIKVNSFNQTFTCT